MERSSHEVWAARCRFLLLVVADPENIETLSRCKQAHQEYRDPAPADTAILNELYATFAEDEAHLDEDMVDDDDEGDD